MNTKLKITLLSDACICVGSSLGLATDIDVYTDINGYPYIPSKRLKGMLRLCAEEMNNISDEQLDIDYLYGKSAISNTTLKGQPGSLIISDALLNKEYKKDQSYKKEVIKSEFVYPRTQTAIDKDTKQAKAGSLRTTNVVKKGLEFTSNIYIPDDQLEIFKRSLIYFRHMGVDRNRGLGLVKVELEEDNLKLDSNKYTCTTNCLKIKITNDSPLMLSGMKRDITNSYISSSTLNGFYANEFYKKTNNKKLADKLFLSKDKLVFSNAYISDDDFNEYIPVPKFIKKFKNLSESGNSEYVNLFYKDENKEKNRKIGSLSNHYIKKTDLLNDQIDINNISIISPNMECAYHHSTNNKGEIDEFFQYISLAKNQKFVSYIYGDKADLQLLLDTIDTSNIFIGKSKTNQYGKCTVSYESVPLNDSLGDVIIFTENTLYTVDGKETISVKEITDHISIDSLSDNYSVSYVNQGGFNMLWGLPKQAKTVIEAGSYIKLNCNQENIVNALNDSRVNKTSYLLLDSNKLHTIYKEKAKSEEKPAKTVMHDSDIVKRQALYDYETIKKDNISKNEQAIFINSTQIERLLLLLKQTNSYDEFRKQIEDKTINGKTVYTIKLKNNRINAQAILKKINNSSFSSKLIENYKLYFETLLNLLKWSNR